MGSLEEGPRALVISAEAKPDKRRARGRYCVTLGRALIGSMLERVFDAFYTTKQSGVGMELSICRSIIDAHGGRLWARRRTNFAALYFSSPYPVREADFRGNALQAVNAVMFDQTVPRRPPLHR